MQRVRRDEAGRQQEDCVRRVRDGPRDIIPLEVWAPGCGQVYQGRGHLLLICNLTDQSI